MFPAVFKRLQRGILTWLVFSGCPQVALVLLRQTLPSCLSCLLTGAQAAQENLRSTPALGHLLLPLSRCCCLQPSWEPPVVNAWTVTVWRAVRPGAPERARAQGRPGRSAAPLPAMARLGPAAAARGRCSTRCPRRFRSTARPQGLRGERWTSALVRVL